MEIIKLRDEYIKLGQALKAAEPGGRRRGSQTGDPGWFSKGKQRG